MYRESLAALLLDASIHDVVYDGRNLAIIASALMEHLVTVTEGHRLPPVSAIGGPADSVPVTSVFSSMCGLTGKSIKWFDDPRGVVTPDDHVVLVILESYPGICGLVDCYQQVQQQCGATVQFVVPIIDRVGSSIAEVFDAAKYFPMFVHDELTT